MNLRRAYHQRYYVAHREACRARARQYAQRQRSAKWLKWLLREVLEA